MATKLRRLVINEISLVDKGANQHAHVTLFKRDVPEIETPKDDHPLTFNASGRGPAHDKLLIAFDNHRRGMGPAQAHRAFEMAWDDLSDDEKDQIRAEEKATEAAKLAAAAAAAAERKKEMMIKMDNSNLQEVIKIAADIDAGRMGNHATKSQWYQALSKLAEAEREPNETREMAVARIINEDAGKLLFKAYRNASGVDYVPPAPAVPVAKANPANEEIRKLAGEMMSADPSLSRLDALVKIHAARPELSAAAKAA